MLCLDKKTITQGLVPFGQTNLGQSLVIPHFCLDLKLIESLNVILDGGQGKIVQSCPG